MKKLTIAIALACAGCTASKSNLYNVTKHDARLDRFMVCDLSKPANDREVGQLDCISYQTFIERLIESQQEAEQGAQNERIEMENQRGGYGSGEHRVFTL